jgi:endogenous inhibitor of DNA gyrase (YacG/DUF329 family)
MVKQVNCPNCGDKVAWNELSEWKPFCSERCRLIDLGEWASEGHRIPGEPVMTPEKSDEDGFH